MVLFAGQISGVSAGQTVPALMLRPAAGTPVQLMVLKEVDSRTAKTGDRFRLRVNEDVMTGGVITVPVGATAWGEVLFVSGTGAAGGKGRLTARLLYIEAPDGKIGISGTQGSEGRGNTAGVVLGVLGFGVLGLLMKGGNAHFKAGDIFVGYVQPASEIASAAR
ncbi:hypothetical protein ASG11_04300 [Sphingomonas sp. Leaf357]|uniref:hypothetical protein n=1 Tax=Sphingomonas sp. Leaf357 TaxID=1736350 RepID=UPI0006FDF0B0|nr:hypothetical protein [Sphingomonas sp. Leaf357]KQS03571.1 hypothetical protein ASG11_04300 [Sphingomonas sp. Leaf357]